MAQSTAIVVSIRNWRRVKPTGRKCYGCGDRIYLNERIGSAMVNDRPIPMPKPNPFRLCGSCFDALQENCA